MEKIPTTTSFERIDYILFSETHNRFIISTKYPTKVKDFLTNKKIPFAVLGVFTIEKNCIIKKNEKVMLNLYLPEVINKYDQSLLNILEKNVKES